MANVRRRVHLTIPVCSANFMKMLGTLLLSIYFFGQSVLQNGVLNSTQMTAQELNELVGSNQDAFLFSGMASVCLLIGVVGIPIFSFLLVEGIQKTSSAKRYVLTVLITAVATEIPYDYAVSGKLFNLDEQSFLWTILISLVMLWLMKIFQGKGTVAVLINILIVVGGCVWAIFFRVKFGAAFVLITALLFLLREHRGVGIFLGVIISLIYISAPLGFIPVALYSGERKNLEQKAGKYGYYAFCPIIAVCFALLANLVIKSIV